MIERDGEAHRTVARLERLPFVQQAIFSIFLLVSSMSTVHVRIFLFCMINKKNECITLLQSKTDIGLETILRRCVPLVYIADIHDRAMQANKHDR
jgi:hypothetical protein